MIIKRLGYSSLIPAIRFSSVFLLTIVLTKLVSIEDYGLWSLFISISGLAVTIGSLNLMYSSQVLLNDYKDVDKPCIISNLFILKFIATLTLSLVINLYVFYSGIFDYETFLIAILFITFRVCTDFFFGISRALLMIKQQFIIFSIENISTLTFIYLYVENNGSYNIDNILILAALGQIASALYGYLVIKNYVIFTSINISAIRKFISMGVFLIPFSYLDLIIASFTPFVIQLYLGFSSVALYSLAQKIALVVTVPGSILSNIYIQTYKKSLKNSDISVQKNLQYTLYLFIIGTIVIGMTLIIFSKEIIILVSNPSYLDSIPLVSLLVICNILVVFNSFTNYFLIINKQERFIFYLWLSMLVIYFPSTLLMIKIIGINGAIYSILLISLLGLSFSLRKYGSTNTMPNNSC